jgi:hypothetical protein
VEPKLVKLEPSPWNWWNSKVRTHKIKKIKKKLIEDNNKIVKTGNKAKNRIY